MWGNQTMKFALKALSLAVVAAASTFTYADEATSVHSVSGTIGVFSSYNLRGITNTPENEDATIQGGLDYSHASGFYAGWWGSTLGYSLVEEGRDAFENKHNKHTRIYTYWFGLKNRLCIVLYCY